MTFIIFKDSAATTFAQSLTGWEKWDDDRLLMRIHDDLIVVNNMFNKYKPQYFGDWGLILPG